VPSGIDGASLGFFDETQVIGCSANCDGSTPAALQRMYREVPRIADRLWQDGTVATGPMRITLLRFTEPPIYRVPLATWSLSIPMSDLARADNDVSLYGFGQGVLLDGESDVATIRQLRAEYRDGVHGDFYWRYLPFRDDEEAGPPEYGLWARDVSPFEDERGLVPGPSP
jgi:hypothetical protein